MSVVHVYLYNPLCIMYIPKPLYLVLLAMAKINMFQFFFLLAIFIHIAIFAELYLYVRKKRVGIVTKFYCENCKGINIASSFADLSTCYNNFKVRMCFMTVCMYGEKS